MAKVDVGKLRKMLRQQPDMATQVAYGSKAIVANSQSFGEHATIIVMGTEEATPEILMSKTELVRFAHEILVKLDKAG